MSDTTLSILRPTAKMTVRHLSVLNYAGGFTAWHYAGNDTGPRDWCRPEFWASAFVPAPQSESERRLGIAPAALIRPGDVVTATNARGEAMMLCFDAQGRPHAMATTGVV